MLKSGAFYSMDLLLRLVLGAVMGDILLGRKAGYHAALWGSVAALIPASDLLGQYSLPPFEYLMSLRSATHSLLFCFLAALAGGQLLSLIPLNRRFATRLQWTRLVFAAMLSHVALDCLSIRGAQVFYPFSKMQIAFGLIAEQDGIFILLLAAGLIVSYISLAGKPLFRQATQAALFLCVSYAALLLVNKNIAYQVFRSEFHRSGKSVSHLNAYPFANQGFTWYAVGREPQGYQIGYYAILEGKQSLRFHFEPHGHLLLPDSLENEVITQLRTFSDENYILEMTGDSTLRWYDLRFGVSDYTFPQGQKAHFLFSFDLVKKDSVFSGIEFRRNQLDDPRVDVVK
ncbi:MAG: metal-dependent hydrolase [Bacteroidetes bacterium]|nr:MAG: metal-dependent hydrolase [Bacteroidota bacterium]